MGLSEDYLHLCHPRGLNLHVPSGVFVSLSPNQTPLSQLLFDPLVKLSQSDSGCNPHLAVWQ